jgi:photosystem II stability/assembly factor-like uncharacterized protein
MNLKSYILILIIINCFGCVRVDTGMTSLPLNDSWYQMPLRSVGQKNAGLMGGEGMQSIYGIAYAKSNPQIVYLVSNTSQSWKSEDGGNLWQMKHNGFLPNGGINISVDPLNKNIVYIAGSICRPMSHYSSPIDGIYRTTDGGETWELVKQTPLFGETLEGEHFAFDPRNSDTTMTKVVYVGTHQDGLLITKDGGNKWETIGFQGERILDLTLDPTNPSTLYLLTVKGFYRIIIKDDVIFQIERLGKNMIGTFKTFALNPKNPSIMYVAMGKAGVYKSDNGGNMFFRLKEGLPDNLDYKQIAISPVNPEYLYISVERWGGLNPFWSHDGGKSWHQPKTLDGNDEAIIKGKFYSTPITPHPFNANIALTSSIAGILKTYDGGITWFYSGNGYTGGRKGVGTTSQAFYPNPEKVILFLIDFGPIISVDGGQTFTLVDIPRRYGTKTTPVGAVSPETDKNIIVTAIGKWDKQVLTVSRDGGGKWEFIEGTEDNYKFISFHPQQPNIVYAQGWKSEDSGNTWKKLTRKVYAIFKGNGDIVYSIDDFGENQSVIMRSDDQGKTWSTHYPYIPVRGRDINEIAVDPFEKDRIYVASNAGLYILNNKSSKWINNNGTSGMSRDYFGSSSIKCIAVDPNNSSIIYAGKWAPGLGHSNGIFRSINYGETWENISHNLSLPFSVWSISINPHDSNVYIGSSHGTWILSSRN